MITAATPQKESEHIELLAPAGSIAAGYAALHYGADAVYLGLPCFSARASAVNFSKEELADITGYAHSLPDRRKIYAAVNTLILEKELGELIDLLTVIADIGVDAVIVQDLGVLNILRRYFPHLKAHASTQMAIHNLYGVEAAQKMGMARVTLARELTFEEIAGIAAKAGIETEVFIHGALCYSYSGLCLFSSHLYGRSGNRGKCAYPCREWFKPELSADRQDHFEQTGGFIFSMKDLALPDYVAELRRIGVTALKIEGRMKSPLYVAAATNYYRHLIDGRLSPAREQELAADVRTIFSRPWTDLYLRTRRNQNVVDTETQGHRGAPTGKVEEIGKHPGGHCLRFKTTLPVELHDGLQIDLAGRPRPFGFAVKSINIIEGGRTDGKKRVFTAPAGARVEIQLPRGHPAIPLGAVIYSASSQKVKQQYDFFTPKPGQFRFRPAADFDISIDANGIDITAATEVMPGMKERPAAIEARRHFAGDFQKARDTKQVEAAIENAFRKLGNTSLRLGKIKIDNPADYFIPVSLLNSARREITAALEREILEASRRSAEEIKIALNAILSGGSYAKPEYPNGNDKQGNFKWGIKTDQPHLFSAFGPDDWRAIDEMIIECVPDVSPAFLDQLDRLSVRAGKSRLRLALPVIMRPWEIESLTKAVADLMARGWQKWQISNLGGLSFLDSIKNDGDGLDISADWPVYAMNCAAVGQLRALGISRFTLSPEDSFENMRAMLGEFSEFFSSAAVIVYQDTPLMISETCVFAREKPSREVLFDSSHGDKVRVISRHGRSIVLNSRPFCLAAHLDELASAGAVHFRADFINRAYSENEMLDIWRRLRSGARTPFGHNANFKRGID